MPMGMPMGIGKGMSMGVGVGCGYRKGSVCILSVYIVITTFSHYYVYVPASLSYFSSLISDHDTHSNSFYSF